MILVTGGTGHIGNVLVRSLLANGHEVRVLALPNEDRSIMDDLAVDWVEGDVLDLASLKKAAKGVDVVYHLAGLISIMPGMDQKVWQVNVEGTRNVIAACRDANVRRLVYTSSIHSFTRVPAGTLVDESIPFDPDNPIGVYDRSKAAATLSVLEAVKEGLDAVIACPTGVIGPFDYRKSEMGQLISSLIGRGPHILVDGAYDFVDVRDVAQGLMLLAEKGRSGEVYILSGEQVRMIDLHEIVALETGSRVRLVMLPKRLAKALASTLPFFYKLFRLTPRFTPYAYETVMGNSLYSCEKAQRELGYKPRRLKQSISETIAWWRERRQIKGI